MQYDGYEVQTRMRSDLLSNLALRAEGVYVAANQGSDSLARHYATPIANLPRRQIDARSSPVAAQRFQWFVLGALILLGAEILVRERAVART